MIEGQKSNLFMDSAQKFQLKPGEKVVQEITHHFIIIFPHIFICLIILILDFFLMYFLFLQGWWGVALFAAVVVLVAFYVLRLIFLYKHNKLLVTNQRVVDFERVSFFEQFVSEYNLSQIKEVEAVVRGIWPRIFRYGGLRLKLYQEVAPFEVYKVGYPLKLKELIEGLMARGEKIDLAGKTDPASLVMAEVDLLDKAQKEEIIRRIEEQLRHPEGPV